MNEWGWPQGQGTLDDPYTPFLAIDPATVTANIGRLRAHLDGLGVTLRAHVKTAKSVDVAALLYDGGPGPITVSTLAEAEAFADVGYRDIVYAVGIVPQKLRRVTALRQRGVDLAVLLDSVEQAAALAAEGTGIPALIEVDCDGHRGGVRPDDPVLLDIARTLVDGGAIVRGVLVHAGESYHADGVEELRAAAENERRCAVQAAEALRAAGHDAPVVSVGSTPTAHFATDLTGVTEVRAGNFVFFDLVMAGIGVCSTADLAMTVVTTVIGHRPDKGWILTDGGWMATSRDRGTARQRVDQGYGLVADLDGDLYEDLLMVDASQEHGVLAIRPGSTAALPDLPVGTRVRILPNHACATAAQYDRYHVTEPGSRTVTAVWPRIRGW
ncbi:DSD1 family PLP-dependent enzyme [Actinomadura rudentiformis]|uniref:DSD1 family PLP-dependent enzyme n=1 Tax=Actinomadura rudentiformis TaxID=359158 RepID=A0A6H9YU06_9ACTN|nr:DSD1 family PLP-dependent enzyme [Actinomadura rudentiformis]KAB2350341.1 DSD1 family PLP-dependent enzyme [Actinomadura rudentiformis]